MGAISTYTHLQPFKVQTISFYDTRPYFNKGIKDGSFSQLSTTFLFSKGHLDMKRLTSKIQSAFIGGLIIYTYLAST